MLKKKQSASTLALIVIFFVFNALYWDHCTFFKSGPRLCSPENGTFVFLLENEILTN